MDSTCTPSYLGGASAGGQQPHHSEEMTPSEVVENLEQAWQNELRSPDLLAHRFALVDCVLDQIGAMERNIEKNSAVKKGSNSVRVEIHRLELGRIRYVLTGYLRKRLEKIEEYVFNVIKNDDRLVGDGFAAKMSDEERKFAEQFAASIQRHMRVSLLDQLPTNVQALDFESTAAAPNLDSYVFVKVDKPCSSVAVTTLTDEGAREEIIDLEVGSQHFLPYKSIKGFLEDGSVTLI